MIQEKSPPNLLLPAASARVRSKRGKQSITGLPTGKPTASNAEKVLSVNSCLPWPMNRCMPDAEILMPINPTGVPDANTSPQGRGIHSMGYRYFQMTYYDLLQCEHVSDSDKTSPDIRHNLELADLIRPFWPVTVMVDCYNAEYDEQDPDADQKTRYWINNVRVFLDFQIQIQIHRYSHRDKFTISCPDLALERIYVTSYDITSARKLFTEPNAIGVLTTKKISDWCYFYFNVYNAVKNKAISNEKVKQDFLKEIEPYHIQWHKENYNGQIKRNGIVLAFTIEPGYISYHLDFTHDFQTNFQTFLKLSDNKWTQ